MPPAGFPPCPGVFPQFKAKCRAEISGQGLSLRVQHQQCWRMWDPTSPGTGAEGCWLFPWVPLCNRFYPKPKQGKGVSFSTFKMISFTVVFPGLGVVQDDLSLLKLGSFYFRPDLALSHAALLRQSCKFSKAAWQPVNRVRTLGEMSFWGYEGDEALGIIFQGGNRCRGHNPKTPKHFWGCLCRKIG